MKNKNKNKNNAQRAKRLPLTSQPRLKPNPFGPVAMINTAPVSIGNSITGVSPIVTNIKDGVRVRGRDFCFSLNGTVAAATNWSLIGGMPITPACLPSSILRSYVQSYNKFKFNSIMVHYVTSSPTSQAGDILIYFEKDRLAPAVDQTNSNFLPYILSDPHTVIGPQWTNHSACFTPSDGWNETGYSLHSDINEESEGSVFVYSKTNAANSPGYVLFDYDITFKELSVNPRAGILPVSRAQWSYLCLQIPGTVAGKDTQALFSIAGNNPDGTASAIPTGSVAGDIFKVIFQITNSTVSGVNSAWSNATASNLLEYFANSTSTAITLDDGFTAYGRYTGSQMLLYPTIDNAIAASAVLCFGVSATITANVCTLVSLILSTTSQTQSSY